MLISAQLLLGKTNIGTVRSLQALKDNKLHHKCIIYHQKTCDRILIVFFGDLLADAKFETIKIFHARTTEEKQETHEIRPFSTKKGMKFVRVYYNWTKMLTTGMK